MGAGSLPVWPVLSGMAWRVTRSDRSNEWSWWSGTANVVVEKTRRTKVMYMMREVKRIDVGRRHLDGRLKVGKDTENREVGVEDFDA